MLHLWDRWRVWWTLALPVGPAAERLAGRWLRRQGYRILATNLRNRYGEVDLLAQAPDGRTIVIVEVKAVTAPATGPVIRPEHHVNRRKQRKLAALAGQIARQFGFTDRPIRFDVVGIEFRRGKPPVIRHHPGAFESPW